MPQLPYPQTNLEDVEERRDRGRGAEGEGSSARETNPSGCVGTDASHRTGTGAPSSDATDTHMAWVASLPSWACVAFGAFLGTAIRAGLDLVATGSGKVAVFSWSTVAVNLCGAFFLGFVTAWAQGYFREDAVRRKVMLVAGSGFAGALTTYATMVMASIHNAVQAMTAVPAAGSDLSGAVSSSFSAAVESSLPLLIEGMLASLVLLVVGIGIAALGYSLGIRAGGSSQLGDNRKASEMPEVLRTASASSPTSNEDSCPRGAKK